MNLHAVAGFFRLFLQEPSFMNLFNTLHTKIDIRSQAEQWVVRNSCYKSPACMPWIACWPVSAVSVSWRFSVAVFDVVSCYVHAVS